MSTTPFMRVILSLLAKPQFVAYADRLLPGEGEDVIQETAIKAHRHERDGKAPPENIPAWLGVVLRNEALRVLQARKLRRTTPRLDPALALTHPALFPSTAHDSNRDGSCAFVAVAHGEHDVEAELAHAIDLERECSRVRAALERLDPKRRRAIEETYFRDVAVRDEAAQGAKFGTVVSRISHAKDDLAAELAATRRMPAHLRLAG